MGLGTRLRVHAHEHTQTGLVTLAVTLGSYFSHCIHKACTCARTHLFGVQFGSYSDLNVRHFYNKTNFIICTRSLFAENDPRDRLREKGPSAYHKICYKNALRLNRYNFRTVNSIDFLFSTLHSASLLYVYLYFRVLHKLRADVMRPDYPWGSKLPHLQVGASNSFQIQCVCRGVLSPLISLICMLSVTEIQLCKVNAHFLLDERHYCMQPAFHSPNPQ